MFGIPSWLVSLLLKLAMNLGLPWLMQRFTFVPKEVWAFIVDALNHINSAEDKPAAAEQLREGIREVKETLDASRTKGLE